jgi:hypothetical protein
MHAFVSTRHLPLCKDPVAAADVAGRIRLYRTYRPPFRLCAGTDALSLVYTLNGRPDDALRAMKTLGRLHAQTYPKAWTAWQGMAQAEPAKYGAVFARLEKPASTLVSVYWLVRMLIPGVDRPV